MATYRMGLPVFPDETSTGVPAGVSLTNSGNQTLNVASTTIDALNITGKVTVTANNCTVKRCRINQADFYGIECVDGVTGTLIEDCEINGQATDGTGIRTASAIIRRCHIYNVTDGILITGDNTQILDCYIHDMLAVDPVHADPITNDGEGNNITVRHNHLYLPDPAHTTAAMTFDGFYDEIDGVLIENNLIRGGTYCLRLDFASNGLTNVQLLNNAFHKVGGTSDYCVNTSTDCTISGNYDYITRVNIDSQLD